jgi:hypothetical protein
MLLVAILFWPLLLSWFVELELPRWHREYLAQTTRPNGLEARRQGRPILSLARTLEPEQRFGLARSVIGNGLFVVFISVPVTIFLGVAGTVGNGLAIEEAVPLALSMWIPMVWIVALLVRRNRASVEQLD